MPSSFSAAACGALLTLRRRAAALCLCCLAHAARSSRAAPETVAAVRSASARSTRAGPPGMNARTSTTAPSARPSNVSRPAPSASRVKVSPNRKTAIYAAHSSHSARRPQRWIHAPRNSPVQARTRTAGKITQAQRSASGCRRSGPSMGMPRKSSRYSPRSSSVKTTMPPTRHSSCRHTVTNIPNRKRRRVQLIVSACS